MIRDIARLVLGALVLVALALGVLRPLIKNISAAAIPLAASAPAMLPGAEAAGASQPLAVAAPVLPAYEQQLVQARTLVAQDPKRVAQVVKTWVGE
jgi:flagellar M-ring protein FliF